MPLGCLFVQLLREGELNFKSIQSKRARARVRTAVHNAQYTSARRRRSNVIVVNVGDDEMFTTAAATKEPSFTAAECSSWGDDITPLRGKAGASR